MGSIPGTVERRAASGLLALCAALLAALPGRAGLEGEQVIRGEVSFDRQGDLTVVHASDGSIIHYEGGFDVFAGETVEFVQPHAGARVLNRDLSFDPSHIEGALRANGIVYLVNPAGVFVGSRAVIEAAGFVAAAGHISDADFLARRDAFTDLRGEVENRGAIHAQRVALLGRAVANRGSIVAPEGTIALVAGERVVLTRPGGHVFVRVDGPAADPGVAGVENTGLLDAEGGEVVLTTGDLYSLAVNHSGLTRARHIAMEGGDGGLVRVAGTLDASDPSPGATGGTVEVLGEKAAVHDAEIDASGATGGGVVRIGGARRGEGPTRRAARTFVARDARIRADALDAGDGGEVIVWSDEATGFHGRISARGGPRGGDGGFAEVSSPGRLEARGAVDLGAPHGRSGTLLYDPQDIEIRGGSADGSDFPDEGADALAGSRILFGDVGDPDDPAQPFVIFESEIEGTDAEILLEARNSIAVSAAAPFDHDGDGPDGTADPGLDVVLIRGGNRLTLRTRNEPGDEEGSDATPGIDLTAGGALPNLEFRTTGAPISVLAGEDATAAGGGRGEPAGITVGSLSSRGADGPAGEAGPGMAGGRVLLRTRKAPITVLGSIDSSGGSALVAGGASTGGGAGAIELQARGRGDVEVIGRLDANGGAGAEARGGTAGRVVVQSFGDGAVRVGAIEASGGDGSSGGIGGLVQLRARGRDLAGDPLGVALRGRVEARGGAASDPEGSPGVVGNVSVIALGAIEGGGQPGAHVASDGRVTLDAASIGESGAVEVEGLGAGELLVRVAGRASVATSGAGFGLIDVLQADAGGDVDIAQVGGGDAIDIDGTPATPTDPGASTILTADTTASGASFGYTLGARDAAVVVEGGAVRSGGDVALVASGPISRGALPGPHVASDGDVSLDAASVGESGALEIAAGPEPTGTLLVRSPGRVDIAVTEAGFDSIAVHQRAVGADVDIAQAGGDRIDIDGTPAGDEGPGASAIAALDTSASGASFAYQLDGGGAPLTVESGARIGGDALLLGGGDILLGSGPGTAIEMTNGGNLVVQADRDADRRGSIVVAEGAVLDMRGGAESGGALGLFSAEGVGTAGAPVRTRGGARLFGFVEPSNVGAEGGIFVENADSGDLVVRGFEVANPLDPGGVVSFDRLFARAGPLSLTNAAPGGALRIESQLQTVRGDVPTTLAADGPIVLDATAEERPLLQTGPQRFDAPVRVRGQVALLSAGGVEFTSTVDAEPALPEDPASGSLAVRAADAVRFPADVGAERPLESLEITRASIRTVTEIGGSAIATEGAQRYGTPVTVSGPTRFVAGDAVEFAFALDGPGGAAIESGGDVVFARDLGAGTRLAELSVRPGAEGNVVFTETARVVTGAGGIQLDPDGRAAVPETATVFKTGPGGLSFSTAGDFSMGRRSKLSVPGPLRIRAARAQLADVSATGLVVDADATLLLGREAGAVRLPGGGSVTDGGGDLVANKIVFTAAPVWDGEGERPTLFTAAGAAIAPGSGSGSLSAFALRRIDARGGSVGRADFTDGEVVLDLTGTGPLALSDPATQNVAGEEQVAAPLEPRFSQQAPLRFADASGADALDYLRCAQVGNGGLPPVCAGVEVRRDARAFQSERARQAALAYRRLAGPESQTLRASFRDAATRAGRGAPAIEGPALRLALRREPGGEPALAFLDRLGDLLTQLGMLNLSQPEAQRLEQSVLEELAGELAVAGLSAPALGEAARAGREGFRPESWVGRL